MRQIITEAIFRRKTLFWRTVLVVVGIVAAVNLLTPRKYEAEAKLLVQNVRMAAPLSTSPADRVLASSSVAPEQINSQVDLLESQAVARRALAVPLNGATTRQNSAVTALGHHLTVEAVHQTSLINVKLLAASPEQARAQLEKVINAYFEERAGTALSTGAAAFFEQQVMKKSQQLQDEQRQLTQFEMQHGISDLEQQKRLQVEQIAGLENQLLQARAQLAAQRSRTAVAQQQMSVTSPRIRSSDRVITNQYSQERLGTELVDLQNRRTEVLKRYPPTDQQVSETDEKIATVQRAIAGAKQNPAGEQTSDINPLYQQLTSAVASGTGETSAKNAEVAALAQQLNDSKSRLDELEQATVAYDALKRSLAQAQEEFALYARKRDEARIAQALDKARMFDVSLVQPPIATLTPVRPKPVLYMAAGTVFALLLATLLALYADTSTEQVYTPAQLDAVTGMRTVATVAEETGGSSEANALAYRRILLAIRNALREREVSPISYLNHGAPADPLLSGDQVAVADPDGSDGYCVAVLSALRQEGVSYIVRNLAHEAARHSSSRVAVLDVRPLLKKFEVDQDASFAMEYDPERKHWRIDLEETGPAGAPLRTRAGLQGLFSSQLRPLLVQARKEFDFVFLDCPSLQESTIAGELDGIIDGYLGVIGAARARKQNIEDLSAMFEQASSPLLGYVLSRREYPLPAWAHRLLY